MVLRLPVTPDVLLDIFFLQLASLSPLRVIRLLEWMT